MFDSSQLFFDSPTLERKELSVSNSRVTLTVPVPSTGATSFHLGDVLRAKVTLHGSNNYTDVSLKLLGQSSATIMGLDRWQAGVVMNSGFGSPGTLITSQETLSFLEVDIPLTGSANAEQVGKNPDKKGLHQQNGDVGAGMYEFKLPQGSKEDLMPSYALDLSDLAQIGVAYFLQFRGTRKGVFKSNDKLNLPFPVSIPRRPQPSAGVPFSQWATKKESRNLKFKSGDGSQLGIVGELSCCPLSRVGDPILFRLKLSSSSTTPLAALLPDMPKVTCSLSVHMYTKPIEHPSRGRAFEWAGTRIAGGAVEDAQPGGDFKWKGKITVPLNARTVKGKGVIVNHTVNCSITSSALTQNFVISEPIFLPSSQETVKDAPEIVWNADLGEGGGGGGGGGEQLPQYTSSS